MSFNVLKTWWVKVVLSLMISVERGIVNVILEMNPRTLHGVCRIAFGIVAEGEPGTQGRQKYTDPEWMTWSS